MTQMLDRPPHQTLAFIYIRFSTPKQEAGSSKDRQLEDVRAFIKRMGWQEAEIIEDLGRSAWKGDHLKRGNLGKFRARIDAGEIRRGSVIVVEEIDRLSRQQARVAQRWMEDVCDLGFQIATARNSKVYNKANLDENLFSIMEILMKAQGAWDYVERLSHRVTRSYEKRLEQARIDNTPITTIGPAWLQGVREGAKVTWVRIEDRVAVVIEIYELAAAGLAPWDIAKTLNQRGTPSFTGKAWERTAIVKILRNRAIEGDKVIGKGKNSTPTGEVLVRYYGEPIVPLDLIAEARAMLDRRSRPGKGRNSGKVLNLFGQKLRCGQCGGRMMTNGYQSRYLVCYEAHRGNGCTQKQNFHYRPFEAAALDRILHLALDDRFFRQAETSNKLSLDVAILDKSIRDKQAQAARLIELLSRRDSPSTEASLAKLDAEIKALKAKLVGLQKDQEAARGAATAEEHLRRVFSFKDALTHAQDDVRLPARLRVSQALAGVVDQVACMIDGDKKRLHLTIVGGRHSFTFDNEGKVVFELSMSPEAIRSKGTTDAMPTQAEQVGAYLRRREGAGELGTYGVGMAIGLSAARALHPENSLPSQLPDDLAVLKVRDRGEIPESELPEFLRGTGTAVRRIGPSPAPDK
jgi:hypothetical protein